VMQNVENWQRTLKRQFEWDDASRKAASRYDVQLQADKIAERKILPALLIVQGDADKQTGIEPARRAFEALKQRYLGRGEAEQIQFEVIHGLAHNFGPGSGATGSDQASIDLEIEQKTKQWFERFLLRAPPAKFAAHEVALGIEERNTARFPQMLTVSQLSKSFAGRVLFDDVRLAAASKLQSDQSGT
jgi:hypothetical protein